MNREIKFRAQDFTHSWNYGFVAKGNESAVIFPVADNGTVFLGVQIEVLPDTIGQYTGMHDKNGKEIYEGDIVTMMRRPEKRQRQELVRHVVTCFGVCDWSFESLAHEVCGLMMANQYDFNSYRFEVIGNIFDNPELAQPYSLHLPERKPRHRKRNNGVEIEFVMPNAKFSFETSQGVAKDIIKNIKLKH